MLDQIHQLLEIEEMVRHHPQLKNIHDMVIKELRRLDGEINESPKVGSSEPSIPASPPIFPAGSGPVESGTTRRV